ncbi:malto-oligosyltrehalose synthase [Streptomyces zingiberis]|uniref:Malto-oligosyltrehalose synthase n=1 Tax=Streptomyces zingiberis TaxID=2053010 RepID=A0ABX1BX58_9ACTN|nr:malto-oligosyltrehalose synthase [Streptomyces zingiberis]NJQ01046.1 malto-oligosyltrehalose synthase [Streptomyces zingiberis]
MTSVPHPLPAGRPAAAAPSADRSAAVPDPVSGPGSGARSATVPTSTYRLQLQPGFTFAAAEAAVPYLASLGVSHLHLSPVLEAVPGSAHGYDVVDHSAVRAELGGEAGLRRLSATARAHGLGLVVDIVPNHMAVPVPERLNRALWEVLRDGPSSPYARWFDIDWAAGAAGTPGAGRGRILLPVLGGRLGAELRHFRLVRNGGHDERGEHGARGRRGERGDHGGRDRYVLRYFDHEFPVRPGTERLPLPELVDAQWYRPAWWRLARTELNYRRFFTVSELIGVRVQDPEVFAATHGTILRLVREGVVDGLRVDHPDGLADPEGYLRRLREATGGRWTVVEKILTGAEELPPSWPVAGTTGYDALRHADGLFTDPAGARELAALHRDATGLPAERGGAWEATAACAAREVVTHDLAAEVAALTRTAGRICERDPELRDHAPWALRTAIRELLLRVPVYRPYTAPGKAVPEGDAAMLAGAARAARTAFTVAPGAPRGTAGPVQGTVEEAATVDLVRDLALGTAGGSRDHREFCARFAQTSSALRAKAVEDRAFYRYTPLLSATEVGGEPGEPGVSPAAFHTYCARIQRDRPETGTVLSTHDTKRSADVRARIAVLSEAPLEWAELVELLTKETARSTGTAPPDAHVAWTAWQTAFGFGYGLAGPLPADRLVPAVLKAVREAALRTTWTEQDTAYEEAVRAFTEAGPCGPPHPAAVAFARALGAHVRANILGAALVHLTMPGVPDVYQSTEREYRALVDPDNRAPFRPAAAELAGLDEGRPPSGLPEEKLRLTAAALRLRREHPDWFGRDGGYAALPAEGAAAGHCLAFARAGRAVTVTTRLPRLLERSGGWRDTRLPLPPGRWRNRLTAAEVRDAPPLREVLGGWPVALLTRA